MLDDIIIYICNTRLDNWDRLMFLSTAKKLHSLKNQIDFKDTVYIDTNFDFDIWYYDQFVDIHIGEKPTIYPLCLTHLSIGVGWYKPILDIEFIPNGVTHLTLCGPVDDRIKNLIPSSVWHMTFGCMLTNDIQGFITPYVTHIVFGDLFCGQIKDRILQTVTHVTFGSHFYEDINAIIPSTVIHLIIE